MESNLLNVSNVGKPMAHILAKYKAAKIYNPAKRRHHGKFLILNTHVILSSSCETRFLGRLTAEMLINVTI
jgi:hypothetical protein